MENLNLSQAEIEMIQLKRQDEENKRKLALAQKKIDDEKKVVAMDMQIKTFVRESTEKMNAIREYFNELNANHPGLYTLDVTDHTKRFEAINWYYKGQNIPEGVIVNEDNKEIIAEVYQPYQDARIKRGDDYFITVKMAQKKIHGHRLIDDCYKMEIHGVSSDLYNKLFKNTDTVHNKIQDKINEISRNNTLKDLQESGWDRLVSELAAEYPEATIEKYEKTESRYAWKRGRRSFDGVNVRKQVYVTFPNTAKITFEFRNYNTNEGVKFEKFVTNVERGSIDMNKMVNALRGL